MPYQAQPFLGSDIAAFVLALVSILNALLWWRDQERGMGWFSISMAMFALWFGTDRFHPFTGHFVVIYPFDFALPIGLGSLTFGLVEYLHTSPKDHGRALIVALSPIVLFISMQVLAGTGMALIPRVYFHLVSSVTFLGLGAVAWRASRVEPGAGHSVIAVTLWGVPAFSVWLTLTDLDSNAQRYWAQIPLLVLALTLLAVCLIRRRHALETEVGLRTAAQAELKLLNTSLEDKVMQRTADLQVIVAGLESFNRNVSHDLRGSLGGIAGIAHLAAESLDAGDDKMARRVLPLIATQAETSVRLVASLLALASVSDSELVRQPVDLRSLVKDALAQIRAVEETQQQPEIEIGSMPDVRADPDLILRIFANLIGNAIKFTRNVDGARVDIDGVRRDGDVLVTVRDNGIGFDEERAERMFDPFVRLHQGKFDGHGVGLSIVRRAVERHGGRVWAESRPGAGSSFHFTLPQ